MSLSSGESHIQHSLQALEALFIGYDVAEFHAAIHYSFGSLESYALRPAVEELVENLASLGKCFCEPSDSLLKH